MLGTHVDATPQLAATDGGEIVDAGDDGEILDDDNTVAERPAACDCLESMTSLLCWP